MNFQKLLSQVSKESKLSRGFIFKAIKAKREKLHNIITPTVALKLVARDLDVDLGEHAITAPSKKVKTMSWNRIANYDKTKDTLVEKKDFKDELHGIKFSLSELKAIAGGEMDWVIIGEREENRTDKGNAVFARLSKSKKAIIFFIGDQVYSMVAEAVLDDTRKFIGISRPE